MAPQNQIPIRCRRNRQLTDDDDYKIYADGTQPATLDMMAPAPHRVEE
jgi:hypothetical protein